MSKKLSKMQTQLENLQKQIKNEESRLRAIEAKKRNRKIEIIGGYVLGKAEKENTLKKLILELKENKCLINKTDTNLFEIESIKKPKQNDNKKNKKA